jgi:hypothetical protein
MSKGCFGSLIAASEISPACMACSSKRDCFAKAEAASIKIFGKFTGFPNDKIKKTTKAKTHESVNGSN